MWAVLGEAKKHRAFREAWVAYILGGIFLLISLYQNDGGLYKWIIVQQNIHTYGATLTAFLIAVGLPRLICYEGERGTDSLIRTSDSGCFHTWKAKVLFTIIYCAAVVFFIGTFSLLANGSSFGFEGALSKVEECLYYRAENLPPMSNIAYCILQYVFLFLGTLYFAGFVLILAAITKRTALTIFVCGATYLVCLVYEYAGHIFSGVADSVIGFFHRYGFGAYLLHSSYSWGGFAGSWDNVWKPIMLVIVMTILEFYGLWLIWRRRATK